MRWCSAVALVAVVAAPAAILEACGQSCTAMACGEENLRIELASRCWPDGAYEVSGSLDGEPFAVVVQLPSLGSIVVSGPLRVEADTTFGFRSVGVAGATPAEVELRIRRGDLVVVDERLAPAYERREINGEGCEPVCTFAREELVVDGAVANALCDVLEAP